MMDRKKVLELDKICRVCISERKDMRPLFSEKVAEMLMEFSGVEVEPIEGWPDRICVQCVHSVSRCHAFKALIERNDKELREYISSLTVQFVVDDEETDQHKSTTNIKMEPVTQHEQNDFFQIHQQQQQQQLQKQKLLQKQLKQQQQEQQRLQEQQKLQQEQQKLLEQQKLEEEQKLLEQQKLEEEQQKQQEQLLLQEQLLQQQLELHQQQQQQQSNKRKAVASRKSPRVAKKSTTVSITQTATSPPPLQQYQQTQQQQQQQQTQQQTQLQPLTQPPALQQQHILTDPITLNTVLHTGLTRHQQQQLQQQQMLSTTATLPQQLVLANGQILLTHSAGAPQIAQLINGNQAVSTHTATLPTTTIQQQFAPQLIQTTSGQTLQLIQQPNGQHTLQLVQLVPQRTISSGINIGDEIVTTNLTDEDGNLLSESNLLDQDKTSTHHLIDGNDESICPIDDDDDDVEEICETIVIDDDNRRGNSMLTLDESVIQSDIQDLEYLDDITVSTTGTATLKSVELSQQMQHHHNLLQAGVDDDDDDDDDDIIEEITMEEEMIDEECMHVMSSEYVSDDEVDHQQLIDECDQQDDDSEIQYTVMEADDDDESAFCDAIEVMQPTTDTINLCDQNTNDNTILIDQDIINTNHSVSPPSGRKTRKATSKTLASTRQLAATATSIATGGSEDDSSIDSKFIADFISQQTSTFGSGRYVCNLCRQEFKQLKGLQNHMHSHSNWIRANCKKQPECEICFKSFKGPGMLKMHMKTHQMADRVPQCTICGKLFKSKAILYRHRQTHQQRFYYCAVENCRKTFSTPITLRSHAERKHADYPDAKYKCGDCGLLCENVDLLHHHVQMKDQDLHDNGSSGDGNGVGVVTLGDDNLSGISGSHSISNIVTIDGSDVIVVTQA